MADTSKDTAPLGEDAEEAILKGIFGDEWEPFPQQKKILTEEDWLTATSCNEMLSFLQPRVTRRKPLLLAVAGCRRIEHLIKGTGLQVLVDTAERYADGYTNERDIWTAAEAIGDVESADWNSCCYTAVKELSKLN